MGQEPGSPQEAGGLWWLKQLTANGSREPPGLGNDPSCLPRARWPQNTSKGRKCFPLGGPKEAMPSRPPPSGQSLPQPHVFS